MPMDPIYCDRNRTRTLYLRYVEMSLHTLDRGCIVPVPPPYKLHNLGSLTLSFPQVPSLKSRFHVLV
jgi:hypothetical protein